MESNLNYVGLSGSEGTLPTNPIGYKPIGGGTGIQTGSIIIKDPIGGTSNTSTGSSRHWTENVKDILTVATQAGLSVAQLVSAFKGNQPIIIANPQTGSQIDVSSKLREEYNRRGEEEFAELVKNSQKNSHNDNPDPKKKDNTLLYVGVGFGALLLIGAMAFALKK